MKKLSLVVILICAIGAGFYFFFGSSPKPESQPEPLSPAAAVATKQVASVAASATPPSAAAAPGVQAPALSSSGSAALAPSTISPSAPTPGASEYNGLPAATVLENMRTAVQLYGHTFGGNPVGTNPEITSALNGNNPKQIKFLQPDAGMRINGNGELIDPWGTPVFFHQLSGSQTEIRSAGPDRKMWTSDDLVIE
jgi:hypothetical protein